MNEQFIYLCKKFPKKLEIPSLSFFNSGLALYDEEASQAKRRCQLMKDTKVLIFFIP